MRTQRMKTEVKKSINNRTRKNTVVNKKPVVTTNKKPVADKTIKKKPVNAIRITSKTYYIDRPNSKGFKIGDQRVIIDSDDYPMSSLDEVNYFIGELVNYSEFAGNYKNKYEAEDANEQINNNSFFKHDRKDWYIIPVKYNEVKVGKEGKEDKEGKEGKEDKADLTGTKVSTNKANIAIPLFQQRK